MRVLYCEECGMSGLDTFPHREVPCVCGVTVRPASREDAERGVIFFVDDDDEPDDQVVTLPDGIGPRQISTMVGTAIGTAIRRAS